MTMNTGEVADKVRAVYASGDMEGLGELFADKVQIVHVPEQPGDGEWEGRAWATADAAAVGAIRNAIPDFHVEGGEVTADGDEIKVDAFLRGTLKDGVKLDHRVEQVFTVRDGKIVKSVSTTNRDNESGKLISQALMDGSDRS